MAQVKSKGLSRSNQSNDTLIIGGLIIVVLVGILALLAVVLINRPSQVSTTPPQNVTSFDLNSATTYCAASSSAMNSEYFSMETLMNICIREQRCLYEHGGNAAWQNSCTAMGSAMLSCEDANPNASAEELRDCSNTKYVRVWCKTIDSNDDPMCVELKSKGY